MWVIPQILNLVYTANKIDGKGQAKFRQRVFVSGHSKRARGKKRTEKKQQKTGRHKARMKAQCLGHINIAQMSEAWDLMKRKDWTLQHHPCSCCWRDGEQILTDTTLSYLPIKQDGRLPERMWASGHGHHNQMYMHMLLFCVGLGYCYSCHKSHIMSMSWFSFPSSCFCLFFSSVNMFYVP